jgi:hypothetical protein
MLTGDNLSTQYFIAGTAIAILGIGMTQAGWNHRWFVRGMFVLGIALALCAFLWKPITEAFPRISDIANPIGSSGLGWLTLFAVAFGTVLWLDYRARTKIGPRNARQHEPDTAALNNALQGLFERVCKIEQLPAPATAEDHGKLVTTVVNLTKDTNARVDRLALNAQLDRDILLLMHFTVYQSTVLMLDDLLNSAPPGITIESPLSIGGDFALKNAQAKEFIDLVRRKMDPGSWRRSSFEGAMTAAENEAEYALEQTPMNERPSGIDPLALRRWAIAHRQCAAAILFLAKEKKEAEENLRNHAF